MILYLIKKGSEQCYVTPLQFVEYKAKWWVKIKNVESRPYTVWEKKQDNKKENDDTLKSN